MQQLPHLSVIEFTGADAADFLDRQLTSSVLKLEPGEQTFSALCNPNGRVVALLLAEAADDGLLVALNEELAEAVVYHLQRFVFRDKVNIRLAEDQVVIGTREAEIPDFQFMDRADAAKLDEAGEDWRASELAAGIAWLGKETTDEFLPQMLGYESIGALSFRKGCYPGQEIIARTHYRGKLKRHALVARCEGSPSVEPMDKLVVNPGDTPMNAQVVDLATSDDGRVVLFLVVRTVEHPYVSYLEWQGELMPLDSEWRVNYKPPEPLT